ncbi:MAG: BON domain-containing protein [Armatimonadota bacterium]|nr:BON domain-containing protein [Armatimonadota bacterium]MCX7777026.1 BON domain-containing protein [Armatimonadota bacterium]MDW8024906.1 BON domain-containing protein [Armatimonadota bacterium]
MRMREPHKAGVQELVMKIRREFNKANLDISRLEVINYGGTINLYGWVVRAKGDKSQESVRDRFNRVVDIVRRMPGVRDVVSYVRIREV